MVSIPNLNNTNLSFSHLSNSNSNSNNYSQNIVQIKPISYTLTTTTATQNYGQDNLIFSSNDNLLNTSHFIDGSNILNDQYLNRVQSHESINQVKNHYTESELINKYYSTHNSFLNSASYSVINNCQKASNVQQTNLFNPIYQSNYYDSSLHFPQQYYKPVETNISNELNNSNPILYQNNQPDNSLYTYNDNKANYNQNSHKNSAFDSVYSSNNSTFLVTSNYIEKKDFNQNNNSNQIYEENDFTNKSTLNSSSTERLSSLSNTKEDSNNINGSFNYNSNNNSKLDHFSYEDKNKKNNQLKYGSSNQKKTRTKDKYRVVYNELQRTELEKEFNFSKYITSRRKSELASILDLSQRQIKIWFQNRRAKDRKIIKKKKNDVNLLNNNVNEVSVVYKTSLIPNEVTHLNNYKNKHDVLNWQNGHETCNNNHVASININSNPMINKTNNITTHVTSTSNQDIYNLLATNASAYNL